MKKIIILLSLSLTALFGACKDDNGNYDYTSMEGVEVSGLFQKYTLFSFQQTLEINPTVSTRIPEENLEYLWICYQTDGSQLSDIDTIGRTKNLVFPVNLAQGNYTLSYQIKDKSTGLESFFSSSIEAVTEFSRGFYVLKETAEGHTDMDMHADEQTALTDILSKSFGEPMEGKPTRLGYNLYYSFIDKQTQELATGNVLIPMSAKDARTLRVSDMMQIYSYSEMFFGDLAPDEVPYYAAKIPYANFMVTSKGVYSASAFYEMMPGMGMENSGKFGYPAEPSGTSRFVAAAPNSGTLFYYDETGKRFMCADFNGFAHTFTEEGEAGSPNNIAHECIFMGIHQVKGSRDYPCAVFQDRTDPEKRILYSMRLQGYGNPIEKIITLGPGTKASKARLYAMNTNQAKLLYCVSEDNRVSYYVVDSEIEQDVNLIGIGADEEITYIANKFWTSSIDEENAFDYFVVGTHKGGNYKVYLYGMSSGHPEKEPVMIFEGEGIVRDLQYTSPSFKAGEDWCYAI